MAKRPQTSPEERARERQRLRQALLDLCFEVGFANLTLDQLCDRAEVDRAAFHRQFADLEDCFCQVYIEIRDEFLARVSRAIADQPSWRDKVRATSYALLTYLREDERVTHLGVVEVRAAGDRAQLLLGEAIERLFNLVDEGREELEDPDSISRATAESIGGGIFSQIFTAISHDSSTLEEMVPQMMYVAVLPYLGSEAALEELRIAPPAGTPDVQER